MQILRRRRAVARDLVDADAGGAFCARRFTLSHFDLHWHAHPEMELTLIERGAGLRYVGDSVEEFHPGDLVLLGPGLPHSWANTAAPGRTCEAVVAIFAPEAMLGAAWRQLPEARALGGLIAESARGVHVTGATAEAVSADLRQLATRPPGLLRLALLLAALGRIAGAPAGEVRALARQVPVDPPAHADGTWGRLLRHLHERADGTLAIGALAARLGVSPSSFSRSFRRRFGITCGEYIARVRIARAGRELIACDRPIADIAFAAGFANLANFNRRFRSIHHMTPREFRRRHRPGDE